MADLGFELEEIARLIRLVETRHLSELVVEDGEQRIVVRGAAGGHAPASPGVATDVADDLDDAPDTELDEVPLVAPMVGVFYRSGGPDQPPYAEAGDTIEAGQTIGIIEAMKVFSEVPAERGGIVTRVVAENAHLIRAGEPILFLRPA